MMQRFQVETIRQLVETVALTTVIRTDQPLEPDTKLHQALTSALYAVGIENVRLGSKSLVPPVGVKPVLVIFASMREQEHGFIIYCETGLVKDTFDAMKDSISKMSEVVATL